MYSADYHTVLYLNESPEGMPTLCATCFSTDSNPSSRERCRHAFGVFGQLDLSAKWGPDGMARRADGK